MQVTTNFNLNQDNNQDLQAIVARGRAILNGDIVIGTPGQTFTREEILEQASWIGSDYDPDIFDWDVFYRELSLPESEPTGFEKRYQTANKRRLMQIQDRRAEALDYESSIKPHSKEEMIKHRENCACGTYNRVFIAGEWTRNEWKCDVCPKCRKALAKLFVRAIQERMGLYVGPAPEKTPDHGEYAKPLEELEPGLSALLVESAEERRQLNRELRESGTPANSWPIEDPHDRRREKFLFLIASTDYLPVWEVFTDEMIDELLIGATGRRAGKIHGGVIPASKTELKNQYREPRPFEVVKPELDANGQPVDPDIFQLTIPVVIGDAELPDVVCDIEVTNRESLEAAHRQIYWKTLAAYHLHDFVILDVYHNSKMYTRYSTLPLMIERFNERQAEIRAKQRVKTKSGVDLTPLYE